MFSGNLESNQFIMQVTQESVLLLKDIDLVQTVPMDLGSPITFACCSNPHLAVLAGQDVLAAVLTLTGGRPAHCVRGELQAAWQSQVPLPSHLPLK